MLQLHNQNLTLSLTVKDNLLVSMPVDGCCFTTTKTSIDTLDEYSKPFRFDWMHPLRHHNSTLSIQLNTAALECVMKAVKVKDTLVVSVPLA